MAGFEFDDNVNTSQTNPKPDVKLLVGPTVSGGVFLPFAGGEQFTLAVSLAYQRSLMGNSADSFGAPLSASLILPLYVNHWAIVASDTFSFTDDPLEKTFAFNRTKAVEYDNSASVTATRQLGSFALTLGLSRTDKITPDDPTLAEEDYLLSVTPAFFFRENYSVFWQSTVGLVYPQDPTRTDTQGVGTSLGLSGQITPALSGTLSLGYQHSHLLPYTLPGSGTNGVFGGIFNKKHISADNVDGPTANMGLNYTHPLRPNTTHSIQFFYSPGVTALLQNSNIQETYGVSYSIAHRLSPQLTLAPNVFWTHTADVGKAGSGEVDDIVGVGFGLSRQFNKKLSASLIYRFQSRSSNLTGASYDDNDVNVSMNYTF